MPKYLFTAVRRLIRLQRMKRNEAQRRLGLALRSFRRERNWSQEKFSELIGISTEAVSQIECGLFSPRYTRLTKMACVLNDPVWVIIKRAETSAWQPH